MKLSKKQLEKLSQLLKDKRDVSEAIGNIEIRKQDFLGQAFQLEADYQSLSKSLKDKYGEDVQIDMKNGEILNASKTLKKT